ncbi:MAG: response regulator [Nitrospinaceae bacterium]
MVDVLLVANDDSDYQLLQAGLTSAKVPMRLERVQNVDTLLEILTDPGKASLGDFRPRIIFLDLMLPENSSFKFLEERRNRESFRKIPVVAFSDLKDKEKVERAYELGVNSLVPKPRQPEDYAALTDLLRRYWFGIVKLPTAPTH